MNFSSSLYPRQLYSITCWLDSCSWQDERTFLLSVTILPLWSWIVHLNKQLNCLTFCDNTVNRWEIAAVFVNWHAAFVVCVQIKGMRYIAWKPAAISNKLPQLQWKSSLFKRVLESRWKRNLADFKYLYSWGTVKPQTSYYLRVKKNSCL